MVTQHQQDRQTLLGIQAHCAQAPCFCPLTPFGPRSITQVRSTGSELGLGWGPGAGQEGDPQPP